MVRNDFCLGGASKQNALFQKMCPKKCPHAPNDRIGPAKLNPVELQQALMTSSNIGH